MLRKLFLVIVIVFCIHGSLHAEDNYCYQEPGKCTAGDILILSLAEDVAKYCDFDKQIVSIKRRITTKSSFNNEQVVCVKITTTRTEIKK